MPPAGGYVKATCIFDSGIKYLSVTHEWGTTEEISTSGTEVEIPFYGEEIGATLIIVLNDNYVIDTISISNTNLSYTIENNVLTFTKIDAYQSYTNLTITTKEATVNEYTLYMEIDGVKYKVK